MKLKKLLLLAVSNVKVEVHYALDNELIEPKDYAFKDERSIHHIAIKDNVFDYLDLVISKNSKLDSIYGIT